MGSFSQQCQRPNKISSYDSNQNCMKSLPKRSHTTTTLPPSYEGLALPSMAVKRRTHRTHSCASAFKWRFHAETPSSWNSKKVSTPNFRLFTLVTHGTSWPELPASMARGHWGCLLHGSIHTSVCTSMVMVLRLSSLFHLVSAHLFSTVFGNCLASEFFLFIVLRAT